jgi:hypothetical protein
MQINITLSTIPHYLCDLIGAMGAIAIGYGVWRYSDALGFVVGGLELVGAAMLYGRVLNAKAKSS